MTDRGIKHRRAGRWLAAMLVATGLAMVGPGASAVGAGGGWWSAGR